MATRHKNKNGDGYCRKIEKGRWECTIMSKYINPKTGNEKRIKRVGATEDEARRNAKQALKAWEKDYDQNEAWNVFNSIKLLTHQEMLAIDKDLNAKVAQE